MNIPTYLTGKDCGDFTLWYEEEHDFVDGPHGTYLPVCSKTLHFIETQENIFDDVGDWEEYSAGEFPTWEELEGEL